MTAAVLDAARLRGDPAADALVARLGPRAWGVAALMAGVRANRQSLPAALDAEARGFFTDDARPPAWLQPWRVLRAQRWANEHLLHVTTALFCASLPLAYAAARGARVLAATARLSEDVDRRVNETARFVLDVLAPGAFEPEGAGVRAIQRTRFVHAAVRQALAARGEPPEEVAINQEDLLGTLLGFSVVVIGAVRRLGVAVGEREADDFFHLWRGVGALMGIDEALLPADFTEAGVVAGRIADRQLRASAHGQALMAALLARMEDHVPGLTSAPRLLVRHLVGDRVADLLNVPHAGRLPATLHALAGVPGLRHLRGQALLLRATPLLARPLLQAIVAAKLTAGPSARSSAPEHGQVRAPVPRSPLP